MYCAREVKNMTVIQLISRNVITAVPRSGAPCTWDADENAEAETANVVRGNFMTCRTVVALPRGNPWSNYLHTKHIPTRNLQIYWKIKNLNYLSQRSIFSFFSSFHFYYYF